MSDPAPVPPAVLGDTPELTGQFVRLRQLSAADAELTHAWRHGERARHLNASASSVEDQARWIAARPANEFNWVIEMIGGPPVGMLSLVSIDLANRRAESARFLIGDEAAAKGAPAAVEAMLLLYRLAFDQLGLQRIHGLVEENNGLMIKWQKYLGMKEEGRLRRHFFIGGRFVDGVALGLLEDEYRTVSLPRMKALTALGTRPAQGSAA